MNFKTAISGQPSWVQDLKTAYGQKFDAMEWPGRRDETWRRTKADYFPLTGLSAPVKGSLPVSAPALEPHQAGILKIQDGVLAARSLRPELESALTFTVWDQVKTWDSLRFYLPGAQDLEDKFQAALGSSWETGFVVHLAPRTQVQGILEIWVSESRPSSFPLNLVVLGEGSQVSLVVKYESSGKPFVNSSTQVHVLEGAQASLFEIQNYNLDTRWVDHSQMTLKAGAQVKHTAAHFGAGIARSRQVYQIQGTGANLDAQGMFFGAEDQHRDIRLVQYHQAPGSKSSSLYRGAVRDRSRAVFQGMIDVLPEAGGTDAYLSNKNLILTDGARVESLPQLKIETDDVKCSHGATTGKVNEDQIYYLMARGLSQAEARRLICEGMFSNILDSFPETLRADLETLVDQAIGGQ